MNANNSLLHELHEIINNHQSCDGIFITKEGYYEAYKPVLKDFSKQLKEDYDNCEYYSVKMNGKLLTFSRL